VTYLIGPQDVLDITVFQAPDLSKTVLVANDGAINLPLVGQVPAAGKSPSELERDIERRLNARFLKSAQVTITVKEYNSQRITVEGAVRNPGVFPWRGGETLMQVIARSGGLDSNIASDNIVVFRTINGARAPQQGLTSPRFTTARRPIHGLRQATLSPSMSPRAKSD
jgi:polysaccharide export outer membrane protein